MKGIAKFDKGAFAHEKGAVAHDLCDSPFLAVCVQPLQQMMRLCQLFDLLERPLGYIGDIC